MKIFVVLVEGLRFLWRFRKAKPVYWKWRLGTLYGTFRSDGTERSLKELVKDLWKDRERAISFLFWRRRMRIKCP